jgi:uncharacterized protein (TIGR02466 family)
MRTIELFATPLWIEHLYAVAQHAPCWIAEIEALRAASLPAESRSNRNGWHSDRALFENAAFEPLKAAVIETAHRIFKDYGLNPEDRVLSLMAWANIHDAGGYNVSHTHPGAWISGTIYLRVPAGSGRIYFRDPRPAAVNEALPLEAAYVQSATPLRARETVRVDPKEMMLVAFPGWLEHGVEESAVGGRISIAFNIAPTHQTNARPTEG